MMDVCVTLNMTNEATYLNKMELKERERDMAMHILRHFMLLRNFNRVMLEYLCIAFYLLGRFYYIL